MNEIFALVPGSEGGPALWSAAGVLLFSAILVATGRSDRRAIVALWFSQLGAGWTLLLAGSEMLGLVVWISGTAVCGISFMHADLFWSRSIPVQSRTTQIASYFFPSIVSAAFAVLVSTLFLSAQEGSRPELISAVQVVPGLQDERLILFELLALFSLVALVGAATLSRAGRPKR